MRLIGSLLLAFVVLACFNSCFDAPHFPATPEIEFNNIIFRKGVKTDANITPADSLILTINFKDGDGDLGLGADENYIPFNDKYIFEFPDSTFITYKTKRTIAGYDTLPDFVTPYNCTNWDVIKDAAGNTLDTLYFQLNRNHYNIFVDFYIKQSDDSWKKYDWTNEFIYPNCQVNGFDGRFPILSKDFSQSAAQEGKIRYSMRSVAFLYFFSIKTLKLQVAIQDRALHKSKVLTTPAFTLQSILK